MANINVNLAQASLQVLDLTTNLFRVNDLLGNIVLPATGVFYDAYFQAASGAGTVVNLPAATAWFAVVKNLSATATLTVQHTAQGGTQVSAANSLVLQPGGIWMYVNPVETANGLTGLTLVGSATCPAVVMVAA